MRPAARPPCGGPPCCSGARVRGVVVAGMSVNDDADELVELWARLERLKVGIGGWIITGATMPPEEARAENVDGKIRDLIDAAIEVKARIELLSTPPARHARPAA
jgi:hypothetical protein